MEGQGHHGLFQDPIALRRGIRPAGPGIRVHLVAASKNRIQGHQGLPTPLAMVPAFVAGDAVDPGEKAGFETEAAQPVKDLEEDGLQDVLGLLGVADGKEDQRPDPLAIDFVEIADGPGLAPLGGQNQPPLFGSGGGRDAKGGAGSGGRRPGR